MPETWFLSVDFYLYCTAPLAFWALYMLGPKLGIGTIAAVICASMSYSANHIYQQDPTPIPDLSSSLNIENLNYLYLHVVFPVRQHVPSYFFGVIMGYLMIKKKPIMFEKTRKMIISITLFALMGVMMLAAAQWRNQAGPPPRILSAIFLASYPILWVLPIAWLTYLCMTNQAGKKMKKSTFHFAFY